MIITDLPNLRHNWLKQMKLNRSLYILLIFSIVTLFILSNAIFNREIIVSTIRDDKLIVYLLKDRKSFFSFIEFNNVRSQKQKLYLTLDAPICNAEYLGFEKNNEILVIKFRLETVFNNKYQYDNVNVFYNNYGKIIKYEEPFDPTKW